MHLDHFKVQFQGGTKHDLHSGGDSGACTGAFGAVSYTHLAFMNSNELIEEYLKELSAIPHLDLIRFGTRIPVVFPQRITADLELRDILCKYNKKKIINIVTQFNHPREITQQSAEAVEQLLDINILVKNQTVLLKGINDDSYILGNLIKKLTAIGVIPYYCLLYTSRCV